METIKIKLENLEDATNKYNSELLNEELDNYITQNCQLPCNKLHGLL